ncbi:uncharacterized protein J3R85_000724 [Psidium guajava]|nr:uncharacterized protein J3R85_000724 [Psidium guajava]
MERRTPPAEVIQYRDGQEESNNSRSSDSKALVELLHGGISLLCGRGPWCRNAQSTGKSLVLYIIGA